MVDITVTMNGLDKAIQNITTYQKQSLQIVDAALDDAATKTASDAAMFAPGDIGAGITMIGAPLAKTVHVDSPIAAYLEFGTGEFVEGYPFEDVYPDGGELRNYAMTFFVNGKGRLPPSPYLFPAFMRNTNGLEVTLGIQLEEAGDLA